MQNGNLAAAQATGILTTRPDYIPQLNITAGDALARGGFWSAVPFSVVNHGNGATTVNLTLSSKPEPSDIRMPKPTVVNPGDTREFDVMIRMPWTGGINGALIINVGGTSAANPLATNTFTTTATANIQSVSPVPSPGIPTTLAALGAAALGAQALGRRRPRG
jgi:hypothetical protein